MKRKCALYGAVFLVQSMGNYLAWGTGAHSVLGEGCELALTSTAQHMHEGTFSSLFHIGEHKKLIECMQKKIDSLQSQLTESSRKLTAETSQLTACQAQLTQEKQPLKESSSQVHALLSALEMRTGSSGLTLATAAKAVGAFFEEVDYRVEEVAALIQKNPPVLERINRELQGQK